MSSSKKKKRPSAGDELINSLFDEVASKGSGSPKARSKTTQEVDKVFGQKDKAALSLDQMPPLPDISEKLQAAEMSAQSNEDSDDGLSLELAVPGKHNTPDPFEEFKRKRAAKAKNPNEVEPSTGSIPVLDLERAQSAAQSQVKAPAKSPVKPSAPPPAVANDFDDLADFTSDDPEQSKNNWKADFGAVSAPEEFAPTPNLFAETSEPKETPEEEFVVASAPEEDFIVASAPEEDFIVASAPEEDFVVPSVPEEESPSAPADEERTMRLVISKKEEPKAPFDPIPTQSKAAPSVSINRSEATEIRAGIRVPPAPKLNNYSSATPTAFTSAEAQLKQSESLRIAQNRITELERELERLRRDNEALSTAGDTLRRRGDELLTKTESLDIKAREATQLLEEERRIMRGQLQAKDRDNAEMRARVEEIETRLESNFKKIRVRERELEHRLEIVKMESATLVSTKDKMILDLKRQIDQLTHEHDYAKTKTQELFNQYKDKQETQRRVVRALRIALTILEGDDETVVPLRKAE